MKADVKSEPLMQIDCGVCTVRTWQPGDESALARHANSREIWLNLRDQFPHPYTAEHAAAWVGMASVENPPTQFAIVLQEVVGGIGLTVQGDIARVSAEIGYWLGASHWNKGIMTAALRAVTDYAFTQFSLTRVFAVPYATNIASHRVLEKVGYVREGIARRSAIKHGTVLDQVVYAMTDRDRESVTAFEGPQKRERLRFDVFGRRIDVERTPEGWAAFVPGNDGKRRPAHISIPPELEADEVGRYLGDLFHESATPKHPTVRLLSAS